MNREPLTFNPLFHNAAINFVETKWNRRLDDHEKHLISMAYDYLRTAHEIEEIHIVEDLHNVN